MKISDRNAAIIENTGVALALVGVATFAWAFNDFNRLPNYLRIASLVPLFVSLPMVMVDSYRSGWSSLDVRLKGRAITALITPVLLALAAIWWYLNDPTARA